MALNGPELARSYISLINQPFICALGGTRDRDVNIDSGNRLISCPLCEETEEEGVADCQIRHQHAVDTRVDGWPRGCLNYSIRLWFHILAARVTKIQM